jgi:two-component system, OmpR family, phosphate regulon response regulator PhoB
MQTILIVEDHADIRKLLRMTMEFDDYDIHESASGDAGWVEAQRLRPDVVLLDLMMPGTLDGLDVCRLIKASPDLRHTKVVMLTARGQAHDREAGYEAGADEYLVKPFSTLQVLDTLYRLEGRPS